MPEQAPQSASDQEFQRILQALNEGTDPGKVPGAFYPEDANEFTAGANVDYLANPGVAMANVGLQVESLAVDPNASDAEKERHAQVVTRALGQVSLEAADFSYNTFVTDVILPAQIAAEVQHQQEIAAKARLEQGDDTDDDDLPAYARSRRLVAAK